MSISLEPESVQALRAEAEINRSRLTGTVEELRTQVADTATDLKERLSPQAIKAEVSGYVRDSGNQLWHSLERKARDNPLQAVAIGAAVALPALKLLRAMPAPLLLVGAGLLLSRASNQNGAVAEAAGNLQERAREAADTVTGAMSSAAEMARRQLHDARDYAREGVDSVMETARSATSAIRDRVTGAADDARSAVAGAAEKTFDQGETLAQQARSAVASSWENPMLVAGAGLAIGAIIAAAFPSTRTEENLFAETTDVVRRQAEELAAKGVDAAKAAVQGVATVAGEQGLSVDGLTSLGENLTDKVRAVAERGVEAALGETKPGNTEPQAQRGHQ